MRDFFVRDCFHYLAVSPLGVGAARACSDLEGVGAEDHGPLPERPEFRVRGRGRGQTKAANECGRSTGVSTAKATNASRTVASPVNGAEYVDLGREIRDQIGHADGPAIGSAGFSIRCQF
jgi:hypothetical protein